MSTLYGEFIGRKPGLATLATPSLTALLVIIALGVWLAVIPLEVIVYFGRDSA